MADGYEYPPPSSASMSSVPVSPMGVETDRETLASALYADAELGPGYMLWDDCNHLAKRILTSDWLAARDAELIAATRKQVLGEAVEAIVDVADENEECENHADATVYRAAAHIVANLRDAGESDD